MAPSETAAELWQIERSDLCIALIVNGFVFSILAMIVVTLRTWTRLSIGYFGSDDWFMCAGMITGVGHNAMVVWAAFFGAGIADSKLASTQMAKGERAVFFWLLSYNLSATLVKTSICCALLRLAPQRRYRALLWAMIVSTWIINSVVSAIQISLYQSLTAACFTVGDSVCLEYSNSAYILIGFQFAVYISVDAGCTILPFFLLWDLQMKSKEKIGISILFGLASLATIAAIIRLPYTLEFNNIQDNLLHRGYVMVWAMLELNVGIIAGSMPALWKISGWIGECFRRRRQKTKSPHQEENFGLVTIGQIMGLNGPTRLPSPDDETMRAHSDQQIAFGTMNRAHNADENAPKGIMMFPSSENHDKLTRLPRYEVTIVGGK